MDISEERWRWLLGKEWNPIRENWEGEIGAYPFEEEWGKKAMSFQAIPRALMGTWRPILKWVLGYLWHPRKGEEIYQRLRVHTKPALGGMEVGLRLYFYWKCSLKI